MWLTLKRNKTRMIAVIKNLSPQIPCVKRYYFFNLLAMNLISACEPRRVSGKIISLKRSWTLSLLFPLFSQMRRVCIKKGLRIGEGGVGYHFSRTVCTLMSGPMASSC